MARKRLINICPLDRNHIEVLSKLLMSIIGNIPGHYFSIGLALFVILNSQILHLKSAVLCQMSIVQTCNFVVNAFLF